MGGVERFLGLEKEFILNLLDREKVPGLSMALTSRDGMVGVRAFGIKDISSREPVTADTLFQAASLSKPVFAALALKLSEQGLLDLDRRLVSYWPDPVFPDPFSQEPALFPKLEDARLEKVTARMILSHSAGFPNWRSKDNMLEFKFDPGERFGYSGEGYTYLQRVLEKILEKPFAEYMHANLLAPLGMANSSYAWKADFAGQAATGHTKDGQPAPRPDFWPPLAAASLYTTAPDFARFLAASVNPSTYESGGFSLGESSLALLRQHQITLGEKLAWGMGWGIEKSAAGEYLWQWGDNGDFKAFALVELKTATRLVIFTNGYNGLAVCRELVESLFPGDHPAFTEFLADTSKFVF
ncbi:MAG: beta-lactamase family protein [Chloroflexi bacterium]|nr:beta-lactamase family protein [Chloroflexota bacterium]OJW00700.1 MAG: hypothetical protein BGO39_19835 [Chloroflexi bacterium 54-19]